MSDRNEKRKMPPQTLRHLSTDEMRARRRGQGAEDYDPRELAGDEAVGNRAYSGEGGRETGSPEPTTPP